MRVGGRGWRERERVREEEGSVATAKPLNPSNTQRLAHTHSHALSLNTCTQQSPIAPPTSIFDESPHIDTPEGERSPLLPQAWAFGETVTDLDLAHTTLTLREEFLRCKMSISLELCVFREQHLTHEISETTLQLSYYVDAFSSLSLEDFLAGKPKELINKLQAFRRHVDGHVSSKIIQLLFAVAPCSRLAEYITKVVATLKEPSPSAER